MLAWDHTAPFLFEFFSFCRTSRPFANDVMIVRMPLETFAGAMSVVAILLRSVALRRSITKRVENYRHDRRTARHRVGTASLANIEGLIIERHARRALRL